MNSLLSLGGWSIIPDLASRHLLNFIYHSPPLVRLLRLTPAAPGTTQYRRHYGVTFAVVVLGYLLYTLVAQARAMPPNFYQILGVPHTVDDAGLKLAFRRFAKRNHPDRPEVGQRGEAFFIYVRDAFEALKDPATRFAYDRFGPDALKWRQTCRTPREFLHQGIMASSGYHIVAGVILLFWSALGQPSPMAFWRYILFASLLVAELALILSPSPLPNSNRHLTLLHLIFPHRIVFQHILFLHQLFMFLSVALTRVAPHLIPFDPLSDPRVEQQLLDRTMALVSIADRETSKMVHTELHSISNADVVPSSPTATPPLSPTPRHPSFACMQPVTPGTATRVLGELEAEMQRLVVEANLKKDGGPLRTAWAAAIARRARMPDGHAALLREEVVEGEQEQEQEEGRRSSRETTPTPTPTPASAAAATPGSRSPYRGALNGVVKKEEDEDEGLGNGDGIWGDGSSHFMTSCTPSPYRHAATVPRSLMKSVPRTPGELPSPRPSPSPPPPPRSPSIWEREREPGCGGPDAYRPFGIGVSPKGYFAKGTAREEGEGKEAYADRVRARSVSC